MAHGMLVKLLLVNFWLAFSGWNSGVLRAEDYGLSNPGKAGDYGTPAQLPLPSQVSLEEYETRLFEFVNQRGYVRLGWRKDKRVRDTGPFINGRYYGTHPAVRVFYSPEVIRWLIDGRQGVIPDGAMLIKEQYDKPAEKHKGKNDEELWASLNAWTIMVKDSHGSHDGWFWSNPQKGQVTINHHKYGFPHPNSGFGDYCLRCHASTTSPGPVKEFTFASLRNIEGFPGEPLLFRIDDSWRQPEVLSAANTPHAGNHPRCIGNSPDQVCRPTFHPEFARLFPTIPILARQEILELPPITHDHVVRAPASRAGQQRFVTSDQCMSCHAANSGDFGPTMLQYTSEAHDYGKPARDYSPYAEWRWTPMGLAGRDPIFYAQMEYELAQLRQEFAAEPEKVELISKNLVSTCLRCHGVMGKRQYDLDRPAANEPFSLDHVYSVTRRDELPEKTLGKYGALARDGVSCTVCHRMQPKQQPPEDHRPYLQFFLETSITGNFELCEGDALFGPFRDEEISPYAMHHGVGFKPQYHPYIKSSQLCGSCHTVNLPVVDRPMLPGEAPNELNRAESIAAFRGFHHHVEQATYLEWLNSAYENEYQTDNPQAKSCQDCHMPGHLYDDARGISIDPLQTRIAIIQDHTYPEAENLASHEELHVRLRESGYARHNFIGLNAFLVEMFQQFDDVLGARRQDMMTGIEQIPDAINNFVQAARHDVADLKVEAGRTPEGNLQAIVTVESKVGHRFPSGVGFRRAFLELSVVDPSASADPAVVWASGRTNSLGVIIDGQGQPLASEFFDEHPQGTRVDTTALSSPTAEPGHSHAQLFVQQHYQRHHEVITRQDQVQIYETLLQDSGGRFTTSFIHGCATVKDNRLLPKGWRREGNNPALTGYFLKATFPGPGAIHDPQYTDGSGSDTTVYRIPLASDLRERPLVVRATLYYQSIPPYFLRALFEMAPDAPATQRLHYICSNLKVEGTPLQDWKLKLVAAEAQVPGPKEGRPPTVPQR